MDAHGCYELSNRDKILCAGSVRTEDGESAAGGLPVPEAETRDRAERPFHGNPASRAGLRVNVVIGRWNRTIFGGEFCD